MVEILLEYLNCNILVDIFFEKNIEMTTHWIDPM